MTTKGVIFAGGGTGGHIYPALAIIEQLGADVRTHVLCSPREIDRRVLEPSGVPFRAIDAKPFGVSPRLLIPFAISWPGVVRSCREAIVSCARGWGCEAKDVVVVAMGGFVAAPAVHAARGLGLRTALVNLDAVAGKANRWLASRVGKVYSTYPFPGAERVGPIVRSAARAAGDAGACRLHFGLDPLVPTLLVTGASQGAESINEFVLGLCAQRPEVLEGWQILHQAGEKHRGSITERYAALRVRAAVVGLVDEVGFLWGAGDVAVARAGAGTVAEAWLNAVPTMFLPYPYHKDEHQRHNAEPLAEAGGGVVVRDLIESGANVRAHADALAGLLHNADRRSAMRAALRNGARFDGALQIAGAVRNL